jgi:hypothetical protein
MSKFLHSINAARLGTGQLGQLLPALGASWGTAMLWPLCHLDLQFISF